VIVALSLGKLRGPSEFLRNVFYYCLVGQAAHSRKTVLRRTGRAITRCMLQLKPTPVDFFSALPLLSWDLPTGFYKPDFQGCYLYPEL